MDREEALHYIFKKLSEFYQSSHDDETGKLLGDIDPTFKLYESAKTADPAAWHDWLKAVDTVTLAEDVTETEARAAILALMDEYNRHHGFKLKHAIKYVKKLKS